MSKAMTAAALLIAVVALLREPTAAQQDAVPPLSQWEYATVISNGDPKLKLGSLGNEGYDLVEVRILENNEHSRQENQLIYILKRPKQ
jgi:hypothetical protein